MIKFFELFNLDKKGNPITWSISYDDSSNWYTMSSGRVGGAITTTEPTYCEGKNKGRSNATTPEQQCALEVQSRIEKQRKRGFQDTIPTEKQFEVTLAKEFKARKKFIKFPQFASAKLDGFRCYICAKGMFSRTHHEILSCPHVFEELKPYFIANPNAIIDGELYSHELRDDFNQVASLISRTKNITKEFLAKTKSIIKFHAFDFAERNTKIPYKDRNKHTKLNQCCHHLYPLQINNITLKYSLGVTQFEVNSFEEVEAYLDDAIENGFEGIMLRNPEMIYDEGRSSNLIKYKRFQDSEYKIVQILDGRGNHAGQAAQIICEDENGVQFSVGMGKGWDEPAKRKFFKNRALYEGKMATIIYQDLTPDLNVPRFGKFKAIRK